jgi:hypothetical protein
VRFLFTLHGKVFFAVCEHTAKGGCTATSIFPVVDRKHVFSNDSEGLLVPVGHSELPDRSCWWSCQRV